MNQRRYFGTDGIRGEVGGAIINADFALRLGHAFGHVLMASHTGNTRPMVLIGKDTRISGYMLESALQAGLSAAGVDVALAGPIPTPAVAYLTRTLHLAAGIVISASHNPYPDNGIKFFSAHGMKLPDDTEQRIEAALDAPMACVRSEKLGRARRVPDAAGRYIEFCKRAFPGDLDLSGLTLVVDAAHGAAYHIAPHVFRELGAQVHTIGCEPDGLNINRGVGAQYPDHLVEAVHTHGADLGVALDGDADRLQMVDKQGRIYNGDELLYVIVQERLRSGQVSGVVGTRMTNLGFEKRMQDLGIAFHRAEVGDRYVLEALRARGWRLGGESSGHLLCLDHHTTGDGIIAALQVLTAVRRRRQTLAHLLETLPMYAQIMVNVPLPQGVSWQSHPKLQRAVHQVEAQLGAHGRVLIRASGTEPKLRIMVEAGTHSLAQQGVEQLLAINLDTQ